MRCLSVSPELGGTDEITHDIAGTPASASGDAVVALKAKPDKADGIGFSRNPDRIENRR